MSLTTLLADYNVSISAGFQFEIHHCGISRKQLVLIPPQARFLKEIYLGGLRKF